MKTLCPPIVILLLITTVCVSSFGQMSLGGKLGLGLSKIQNSSDFYSHHFTPSGQIGLYFDAFVGEKVFLSTELLFNQVEGLSKYTFTVTDANGTPVGEVEPRLRQHASYLSLPVTIGFRWKKISLRTGGQASLFLFGETRIKSDPIVVDAVEFEIDEGQDLLVRDFDLGWLTGLSYQVSEKIIIDLSYYHGFLDIGQELLVETLRTRQFILGLKYQIRNYKE